jgi:glucose-1-phosphate thymidylyltransferase
MIYYPLTTLMLAGIRQVLLISAPNDLHLFEALLGDGADWGIEISYAAQPSPDGIAQAFLIGRDFVAGDSAALVLGDNLFYGQDLQRVLSDVSAQTQGATIFGYLVRDPERYGVVSFDGQGQVVDVTEKPKQPRSRYAIPGLYFYDNRVLDIAANLKPSARGELEITDVNRAYLEVGELRAIRLSRGFAWLDAGTHDSLLDSGQFVAAVEKRQGLKIGCPEEVAYRRGFIDREQLLRLAEGLSNDYGTYLRTVADEPQPTSQLDVALTHKRIAESPCHHIHCLRQPNPIDASD